MEELREASEAPEVIAGGPTDASISIAVLGPGVQDPEDPGAAKRLQIRNALRKEGYHAFFPEKRIDLAPGAPPLLDQELEELAKPDVQLVIVLYTHKSPGAALELGGIATRPDIQGKTAVLMPRDLIDEVGGAADRGLVAITVREHFAQRPYTKAQFDACRIVEQCKQWASNPPNRQEPGYTPLSY